MATTTDQPTAAEQLGRALLRLHGGPVFGVAGSGNFELLSTFAAHGGDYVAACHEGGAVTMADGWAQVTGGVGVASVHQGPGLTNATTALCDAVKGRTPLVLLAAELPVGSEGNHQHVDQVRYLEGLGLGVDVARLTEPQNAVATLTHAMHRAQSSQRPVVLQLPLDVLASRAAQHDAPPLPQAERPEPTEEDLVAIADAIVASSAPLILAGRGVIVADAEQAVSSLAERIGAPLVVTAPARGLFHGDPRLLGISGGFTAHVTRDHLVQSDLILAIGTSLDSWTTGGGRLLGRAHVVQVTTEPPPRPAYPRTRIVRADARAFASRLAATAAPRTGWTASPRAAEEAGRRAADVGAAPLDPRTLLRELDRTLPADRVIALDSGHFIALAAMNVDVDRPRGSLFGQAFQSVGLGVSRAVGAAFARPDVVTTAIVGDGGFMMSMQELDTAVRARLPLLVVIVNDSAYGAEVHDFAPLGFEVGIAQFPQRDLAALARGTGAEAVAVESLADLEPLRAWLRDPRHPMVLDCRVDPTVDAVWDMTEEGAAEWSHTE